MTLWMPSFFFGDFSFNDGPLALTWQVVLYGIAQGAFFWMLYAQLSQALSVEKLILKRNVWTPLSLLVLCVIADLTFLRMDDAIEYEPWSRARIIGVSLLGAAVIFTSIFSYMCSKSED